MKKQLKVVHPYSRLMLFSLITILFVAIRIVVDICSFIPQVNNGWSDITWTVCSGVLLIFNIVAIVFAFLQYKMADGKHKILMVLILIIFYISNRVNVIYYWLNWCVRNWYMRYGWINWRNTNYYSNCYCLWSGCNSDRYHFYLFN